MGLEVSEYSPKRIKKAVTGNGNASKEQVSAMLEQILKVKIQAEYNDATDALATAYCHFNQIGSGIGPKEKVSGWKAFMSANPGRVKNQDPNETKNPYNRQGAPITSKGTGRLRL